MDDIHTAPLAKLDMTIISIYQNISCFHLMCNNHCWKSSLNCDGQKIYNSISRSITLKPCSEVMGGVHTAPLVKLDTTSISIYQNISCFHLMCYSHCWKPSLSCDGQKIYNSISRSITLKPCSEIMYGWCPYGHSYKRIHACHQYS